MVNLKKTTAFAIEELEDRQLMSVHVFDSGNGRYVTVTGTNGNDTIKIGYASTKRPNGTNHFVSRAYYAIQINNQPERDITAAGVVSIHVYGFAGNDLISLAGDLIDLTPGTTFLQRKPDAALDPTRDLSPIFSRGVIYGAAGNDTLIGGAAANRLYGQTGNDELLGIGGSDSLYGGAGNDMLGGQSLPTGRQTIVPGSGNDTLRAGTSNDILYAGSGINTFFAEPRQVKYYNPLGIFRAPAAYVI